jgi:hypothetical protein
MCACSIHVRSERFKCSIVAKSSLSQRKVGQNEETPINSNDCYLKGKKIWFDFESDSHGPHSSSKEMQ